MADLVQTSDGFSGRGFAERGLNVRTKRIVRWLAAELITTVGLGLLPVNED
jgi:hypothetical protein